MSISNTRLSSLAQLSRTGRWCAQFASQSAGGAACAGAKRATPPGAIGRVYGTVYSGLDVGFALAAPAFGALLDGGHPAGVFARSALALGLGIASAAWVGLGIARKPTTST